MKDYKNDDKFRCIQKDIHIVLGDNTEIKPMDENEVSIEHAWFDFYDLADLKPLANQNTYLTGSSNPFNIPIDYLYVR